MPSTHPTPNQSLNQGLKHFALQSVTTACGVVQYRQAGSAQAARTCVLLHGIGSSSGSWLGQLQAAALAPNATQVLAWDAPGYGGSQALPSAQPKAHEYAQHLWAWLDALALTQPVVLVGHSLGAIMATSAAVLRPQRMQQLVLLAPAQGYGAASAAVREQKRDDRLRSLQTLGPVAMAAQRAYAMLSGQASAEQIAFVQQAMAQINVAGYTQATHLLAEADLLSDLAQWKGPLVVASGRADVITPMAACQAVALAGQVPWQDLGEVGHACALEGTLAVNRLLQLNNPTKPDHA